MKQTLKTVLAIVLFGVAANSLSEPTNGESNDNQGGRYRLIVVNEGSYSTPYVIDTQTGRVWRRVVDTENKMLVFVSMEYKNIDGELSKVPNETATSVFLKSKAPQSVPQKIDDDATGAAALPGSDRIARELQQKMDADVNKLFPNSKSGVNTNSP